MATDSFWADLGPYAMGALGFLVAGAYLDLKRDARWARKNITKILIKLGIEAEE